MAQENANVLHAALHLGFDELGALAVLAQSGIEVASIEHPGPGQLIVRLVDGLAPSERAITQSLGHTEAGQPSAAFVQELGIPGHRTFAIVMLDIGAGVTADATCSIEWWRIAQAGAPLAIVAAPPNPPPTIAFTGTWDLWGDGSDGDQVLDAPALPLTRDMYFESLTLNPGGVLNTGGYRVHVRGTLTLAGGMIVADGPNGGAGAVPGGGAPGSDAPTHTVGGSGGGGAGGDSTIGNGVAGSDGSAVSATLGANGASGGAGGTGAGGVGTAAGGNGGAVGETHALRAPSLDYLLGSALVRGGSGGGGGGGAAGDSGALTGGGGGGGGSGGALLWLAARIIFRDANSAVPSISALGGMGADGADSPVSVAGAGGGGGAAGGGGGGIYLLYSQLQGDVQADLLQASGGAGGDGGDGSGLAGGGGTGGDGANGGRMLRGQVTDTGTIFQLTEGAAGGAGAPGGAAPNGAGGNGGAGGVCSAAL